ncbi:MAG: HAMP domain-containing sensor histidine kinase [Microcoleus sp.]
MNYQDNDDLVAAEKARVTGNIVEAMEYYDRAIQGAEDNGHIHEQALAAELAGAFYLSLGRAKIAKIYLTESHSCYQRCDAKAQAAHLESKYQQWLTSVSIPTNIEMHNNLQQFNQNLEQLVQQRTSELSQTLADLKSTQNQLVESEKMAALGGLVAGVAHEINTPIGIGIAAASLLAEKVTKFCEIYSNGQIKRSELEKFLDITMQSSNMILANLTRAADLIHSFKEVAVDQSSELKRTFQVKKYLEEILTSLTAKLRTTKHKVEVNCDENIVLDSYPGVFYQIVTNLVINSLIHAYEPDDEGVLTFYFQLDGELLVFEYADNGKGITPENISKIFEPFFTTKRGQGGTGLGLHIIYNLVNQKLQGTIKCQSQLGQGTKFLIKFPAKIGN